MKNNKNLTLADKLNAKKQEQEIKQNLEINKDGNIIIERKSFFSIFITAFGNIFSFLIKTILIIIIIVLSTIGTTVLFNQSLRDTLVNLIKSNL